MATKRLKDLQEELRNPEVHGLARNERGHFYAVVEWGDGKPYYSAAILDHAQGHGIRIEAVTTAFGAGSARALIPRTAIVRAGQTPFGSTAARETCPDPADLTPLACFIFEHVSGVNGVLQVWKDGNDFVELDLPDIRADETDAAYWNRVATEVDAIPGRTRMRVNLVHPYTFGDPLPLYGEPLPEVALFRTPAPSSKYDFLRSW